jgi:thiamine biosynthesis protein ThiS
MKIKFKLYAMLTDFLPQPSIRNETTIEIDEHTTIAQIIDQYKLPAVWVHLVLLNGVYIYPLEWHEKKLKEGDALAIWPPIAGG